MTHINKQEGERKGSMAKKTRRVKKKNQPVRLSAAQLVQPGIGEVTQPSSAPASAQPVQQVTDLQEEYRYVITDLKRIGIIAVAMLAALVVVALLLT
jgi:hypothetical protein